MRPGWLLADNLGDCRQFVEPLCLISGISAIYARLAGNEVNSSSRISLRRRAMSERLVLGRVWSLPAPSGIDRLQGIVMPQGSAVNTSIVGVKGYRRLIPSMTALLEFEAVARLSSFTQAAHELGVTQAAVSRQVRLLEETLGVRLFDRLHRAIRLTREGEILYRVVAEAMQKMAGVFDHLSSAVQQQELVVAATAAFSQFRLLPRLTALRALAPQLQLRLATQMFTADLLHKDVDVAIRFGNGKWQDGVSTLLFDEEVFPVCSPGWLVEHGMPATLADLAQSDLIESDSTSEGWMGWSAWFQSVGEPHSRLQFTFRCSLYTDAVQAAQAGQGVVLGWGRLLGGLLARGELVRLPLASFRPSEAYYVMLPHGRGVTPALQALLDCLRAEVPAPEAGPSVQ